MSEQALVEVTAQPMPGVSGEIGVLGGICPQAHLFRLNFLLKPEQIRL